VPEPDDEATQLMLEALLDIKVAVFEIHRALLGVDDEEEETEEDALRSGPRSRPATRTSSAGSWR